MSVHLNNEVSPTLEFPSSLHTLWHIRFGAYWFSHQHHAYRPSSVLCLKWLSARCSVDISVLHQKLEECKKLHLRLPPRTLEQCRVTSTQLNPLYTLYACCHQNCSERFSCMEGRVISTPVSPQQTIYGDGRKFVDIGGTSALTSVLSGQTYAWTLSPTTVYVLRNHFPLCMCCVCWTNTFPGVCLALLMSLLSHLDCISQAMPLINCIISRCSQWHTFAMDAPEEVWRSLDICKGSLGTLKKPCHKWFSQQDQYCHSYLCAHHSLIFFLCPRVCCQMSINNIPLRALTLVPTTIHNLKAFHVHLYNQASAALETPAYRMSSVSYLEITCNGDVKPFNRIIHLPAVTSLTLQDGAILWQFTSGVVPASTW